MAKRMFYYFVTQGITVGVLLTSCSAPSAVATNKSDAEIIKAYLQGSAVPGVSPVSSNKQSESLLAAPSPLPTPKPTVAPTPIPKPAPTTDSRPNLDRISKVAFNKTLSTGQIIEPVFYSDKNRVLDWDWEGSVTVEFTIYDTAQNWKLSTGRIQLNKNNRSYLAEGEMDSLHDLLKSSQSLAISYNLTLPNGKNFKAELQKFNDSNNSQVQVPKTEETPEPISTPRPTSTPNNESESQAPTPIATPSPIITPTPTPSPESTTPIPSKYPIPIAGYKCRVKFAKTTVNTGLTLKYDWQSSAAFKQRISPHDNSKFQYVLDISGISSRPSLRLLTPSLEPESYHGDLNTIVNDYDNSAVIAYYWTNTIVDMSFVEETSQANISIDGNEDGYIWGEFDGDLGELSDNIWVTGYFSCIP